MSQLQIQLKWEGIALSMATKMLYNNVKLKKSKSIKNIDIIRRFVT